MRVFRYLMKEKVALVLVVCLLLVQAFSDLSIPRMTSLIVDVGIQQQGVEHVAADKMTAEAFDAVSAGLGEGDRELLNGSYDRQGSAYALNIQGEKNRDRLDAMLEQPFSRLLDGAQSKTIERQSAAAKSDEEKAREQALAAQGDAEGQKSIVHQQAIAAARADMQRAGVDMNALQTGYLARTGLAMLGFAALSMVAATCVGLVAARAGSRIGRRLREGMYKQVLSFSDVEMGRFSAASLITRATNDVQLIQMVCILGMRMIMYAPILAIGGIYMVLQTNASMGWIVVVAIVAVFALMLGLMKVAMPKFKIMQKLIDKVNLVAREMLTGLPVVRAYNRESFEERRFDEASTELMGTQLFTNRVMTFMMPVMMLIMNCVSVAIVWFGAGYVDQGVIQTGDLIAFITYAIVIIMSFTMLGMLSVMLPRADVAAARIDEVLDCKPAISDPSPEAAAALPANGVAAGEPGASIAFDDVSFAYPDSGEYVLRHVSFKVPAGSTCAIVGSTGSGKSTVIKLIERFCDATSGSVRVDGIDVRDMPQQRLRSLIGYVPQKAFLFSGTIASNVAYSDPSMDEARIAQATSIAQAAEFIADRPEGLATPIAQGGTNVSGGQRQRLAISRAIATGARAFLFDDSFSALDYRTESAVREQLRTQLAGRTVVVVAQRVSTIMHADNIVVLDEGCVVGQGTHDQLLESCAEYREIALSQLSEEELQGGGSRD